MQSEESNTLVKLAKAVIEHAPEGGDAFWDIKFSDIEAALSAAEPVMYVSERQLASCVGTYVPSRKTAEGLFQLALYRAPPAPSVAVKALRQAASDFMHLFIQDGHLTVQGLEDTDLIPAYEKLSAALSAQVQDVAGLSVWEGWDKSRDFWSETKHKDAVMHAMFRGPWSMEDAAMLLGFIDRTWPKPTAAPAAKQGEAE